VADGSRRDDRDHAVSWSSVRAGALVVRLDQAGGSLEVALHRFKEGCRSAGIFEEIKKRRFYMPPSVRRRAKVRNAAARRARAERRRRENAVDWKPERTPREE
jgi:ribosomal protein S21